MATKPYHVTIVSHTHWDREWYEPFQVFRFQLVELIDTLLALLDRDPAYRSFLLDGQTIVLEDYLAIRPEREADLKRHIQAGRLLIGPWHILPDEFLVSAEATVRNLMLGARVCERFGGRMPVGYTPDPFGHISQLPQILAGCGLDAIALQRGLSDEPTELWWKAPDGTQLLLIYFRAGYGNLAWAPATPDAFTRAVERQIGQLAPHGHTPYLLMLNGTDHMLPQPELPELIAQANDRLKGRATLQHGTLPQHIDAVRDYLGCSPDLPVIHGELRSPKRTPVLPGVYSARMWIKQLNRAGEIALERYAEPVTALAQVFGATARSGELWQAWRTLIENHPHNSICGCSVDQVHDEMRTRFAWSKQIADSVTTAGLRYLAARIDGSQFSAQTGISDETTPPTYAVVSGQSDMAVLVYNPVVRPQRDEVEITVQWAGPRRQYRLQDQQGNGIPYRVLSGKEIVFEDRDFAPDDLTELLDQIEIGFYKGRLISDVRVWIEGDNLRLELVLPEYHTGRIGDFSSLITSLRNDPRLQTVRHCHLATYLADVFRLAFIADDVPGVGYRAYWLANVPKTTAQDAPGDGASLDAISALENEWLRVQADPKDGTLRVTDKLTGRTLQGLNRLQDGGDRGDEYNFCAPQNDTVVINPIQPPAIEYCDEGVFGQSLVIRARYAIPADLTSDRAARVSQTVEMPVTSTVRLLRGKRRIDIHTEITNAALNHRLRVLFPCGVASDRVIVDGHFDRLERTPKPGVDTTGWAEQPAPTAACCDFTAVEQEGAGLMIAVRGLPEYEHMVSSTESTLALTLMRAVGWLSRDDLACRPGHAGPARMTPGAQCIGPSTADYSVIPFGSTFTLDQAAQEANAFAAPLRGATAEPINGNLPPTLQLISLTPDKLILTAVKPAEFGKGIILRFYNSQDHTVSGQLTFGLPFQQLTSVNLLEEPHEQDGVWNINDQGEISLNVPPKRIVSLRVDLSEL